ncbi:MAG: hypothetical protein ACHREM_20525 [Polyangiales bacterium]
MPTLSEHTTARRIVVLLTNADLLKLARAYGEEELMRHVGLAHLSFQSRNGAKLSTSPELSMGGDVIKYMKAMKRRAFWDAAHVEALLWAVKKLKIDEPWAVGLRAAYDGGVRAKLTPVFLVR